MNLKNLKQLKKSFISCLAIFFIFFLQHCFYEGVSQDEMIPIKIFESNHIGQTYLDENKIYNIVRESIDVRSDLCLRLNVKVIYEEHGAPDYLIVYILSRINYSFRTVQIDLDRSFNVTAIEENYQEQEIDLTQGIEKTYAYCPDNSVEMVFSTCEKKIQSAIKGIDYIAASASKAGYKVKKLHGSAENIANIKNWLSCPNLIAYGRIGHGLSTGIILDDGKLTSSYFKKLSSTALNDVVLFFNSCQVHNSPLEPSIINAGAQKFIGGDTNLTIGPSEQVFKCWIDGVVKNKSIQSTLKSCTSQISNTGKFGISGNGDDYLSSSSSQEPIVSFSEPTAGSTTVNPNLGVVVNASDPDGSIVNVRLWINGIEVRLGNPETSTPYEWGEANSSYTDQELLNLSPGNYTLKATAKDNGGNTNSATISITVEEVVDDDNDNVDDNNDEIIENNPDINSLLETLGCG